jgi:hypothetical protein
MKKLTLIAIATAVMMFSSLASAQSATGTLSVTATVNGSINLVFNNATGGVALTGAGTNAATLALGNVSAYGALNAGVGRSVAANSFTVSSPVQVVVQASNSSSANYSLTAQLASNDGLSWQVNGVSVTNGSAAPITATGAYGATGTAMPIAVTVPFATASGTPINNSIAFIATAN